MERIPCRWEGDSVGFVTFQYKGLELVSLSKTERAEQNPPSLYPTSTKPEKKLK